MEKAIQDKLIYHRISKLNYSEHHFHQLGMARYHQKHFIKADIDIWQNRQRKTSEQLNKQRCCSCVYHNRNKP